VRALLAQLASVQGQPQANAKRAIAALAAHPEVELAVFPELFLSGYTLSVLPQTALRLDSPELRTVAEAASDEEALLVAPVGTLGTDDERVDYLRQLPHDLGVVGARATG